MAPRYVSLVAIVLTLSLAACASAEKGEKGDSPDEKTEPTPPEVPEPAPLQEVWASAAKLLEEGLHEHQFQWLNGVIGLVLGSVMVCDGQKTFKYVFMLFVFGASFFAMYTLLLDKSAAMSSTDSIVHLIMFGEVSVVLAWTAYDGFLGIQVLLGAAFGIFVARTAKHFLEYHHWDWLTQNSAVDCIAFTICVIIGVWGLRGHASWKIAPISLLSALIGSCLIASSLAFLVMLVFVKQNIRMEGLEIPPSTTKVAWIDFVKALLPSNDWVDVGVFANSKYNPEIYGHTLYIDHMIGCCLWFAFFLLGVCLQKNSDFCRRRKPKVDLDAGGDPLLST